MLIASWPHIIQEHDTGKQDRESAFPGPAAGMLATARDLPRLDILEVLEKPQVRTLHFEMFNDGCIEALLSNTWLAFIYFNYNKQLKIGYI